MLPSLIAWELDDTGEYAEVARATGAEQAVLRQPFELVVVPEALVR